MREEPPCCSGSPGPDPLQLAGQLLRRWQHGVGQLVAGAQQASAQAQLHAIENLQHLADALASPARGSPGRRRARPAMMCCLSSGAGGLSGPPGSVRLPRSPELGGSLNASKESSAGEQGRPGTEGSEEPILISEVWETLHPSRLVCHAASIPSSSST
jgi:hypothetical protein